jgi:histidinol-phosphate aminotransferase
MLGVAPQDILDFSANLNPFGPPVRVMEALSGIDVANYPDSDAYYLRSFLAERLGMSSNNILIGSGSTELIRLAALAYFGKDDKVLLIEPTYGEYELACRIAGASVIKQQLSDRDAFLPKIDETIELIKQYRPKGIFICNPNNPTGRYIAREDFGKILAYCRDSLVVLDEAYVNFVDVPWSSLYMVEGSNLLIVRSMTKDCAMAGLRLGYGVAKEEIIANLRRICPPWNVSALAQKAGVIAIAEEEYLKRCQAELRGAKDYLRTELSSLGLSPLPSEANFFLVDVGNAAAFRQSLLQKRILVRDCSSFGLPSYIRIAPRTLPECQRLVAAIREVKKGEQ